MDLSLSGPGGGGGGCVQDPETPPPPLGYSLFYRMLLCMQVLEELCGWLEGVWSGDIIKSGDEAVAMSCSLLHALEDWSSGKDMSAEDEHKAAAIKVRVSLRLLEYSIPLLNIAGHSLDCFSSTSSLYSPKCFFPSSQSTLFSGV